MWRTGRLFQVSPLYYSCVHNSITHLIDSTFKWAITQDGKVPISDGLEHPELPEGAGEFLDSWLMLLEKMVNPRMVLESPHTMPATKTPQSSDFEPFNPVQYLIRTHRVSHTFNLTFFYNLIIGYLLARLRMYFSLMGQKAT